MSKALELKGVSAGYGQQLVVREVSLAVEQGYGRILSYPYYGETVGTINAGMLVTREMIETEPEKVQQLVDAHARATEALLRDRDRWLQKAESFGTPRTVLDQAAANIELAWKIDADFIRRARALGERMQAGARSASLRPPVGVFHIKPSAAPSKGCPWRPPAWSASGPGS